MSTIDNRVVQMEFDNKQFENGIQTSIKSLDNLKTGLKLEGATSGLSGLEKVARSFTLGGMADNLDYISGKFSALGIIGITALQNITFAAMDAGKRMVSALTIDPIKTGLNEYETKMGAIQTILTNTGSKGTTLEDVNQTLNELNKYSDQTIYNFAEMARNIGTFTAAGVDLKTSATAIKGIANLAAGSGSSSQQASTAMYQLSQAIAAGSVKLMDWNSVVNAGMGGELFQNALKETAKGLGIVVDESVPFRESLQDGWITTEVLTKTLQRFAEDKSLLKAATEVKTFTQMLGTMKESMQSGWAQSWENIIGDKEQSAKLFTAINDSFGAIVGSAADARNEMLKFWNETGGRQMVLDGLVSTFKGIQAILKPIGEAFREIFPAMTGERLVEISQKFQLLMVKFKIGAETAENIKRTFKGFFAALDIGRMAVVAMAKGLGSFLTALLPIGDGLLGVTGNFGDFLVGLRDSLKSTDAFTGAFTKLGEIIKPLVDGLKAALSVVTGAFAEFNKVDTSGIEGTLDKLKAKLEAFGLSLKEGFLSKFTGVLEVMQTTAPFFTTLAEKIGGALTFMKDKIVGLMSNFDSDRFYAIFNGSVLALVLLGIKNFMKSLTTIVTDGGDFLGSIKSILTGVSGSLEAFQTNLKAEALLKIGAAIALLAVSLLLLASIDPKNLSAALAGVTIMFVELFGAMAVFEKFMGTTGFIKMQTLTVTMIGMSVAILILAAAVKKLGSMEWEEIGKGLAATTVLIGLMVGASILLSKFSGKMTRGAFGMLIFAGAILVLASAVKKLGEMDVPTLIKGIVGLGLVMGELLIFMKLMGNGAKMVSTAFGLTILAVAMNLFAGAIRKLGEMHPIAIATGLAAMAGVLGILAIALKFMPKDILGTSAGLVGVAIAMNLLVGVIRKLGEMHPIAIATGLITMAAALGIIVVAMKLMTGALPGAAALLVVAGALSVLTGVLLILGAMSLEAIGKGLLALAGIFIIIGVAGLVLAPLTPVLLALGASMLMLGAGTLAVGAGLLLFSAGLTALAAAGTAGVVALTAIVTSLLGLIPYALTQLAQGLIGMAKVIGEGAPIIAEAFVAIVTAIIDALIQMVPKFVEGVFTLLEAFLNTCIEHTPKLVQQGADLIIAFIEGIASKLPDLIQAGFDLILSFINGLADAIRNNTQAMIDAITNLFTAVIDAGLALFGVSIADFVDAGDEIMNNGFVKGITGGVSNFLKGVGDFLAQGIQKIKDSVSKWVTAGKDAMQGFIDGVSSKVGSVVTAIKNTAGAAIDAARAKLQIHSPSKVFTKIGEYTIQGFANGLRKSRSVAVAASEMGNTAIDSLRDALKRIGEIVNGALNAEPTIRPVMDLSNVEAGTNKINSMLNKKPIVTLTTETTAKKATAASSLNKTALDNQQALAIAQQGIYSGMQKDRPNAQPTAAPSFTFHVNGNVDKTVADDIVSRVTKTIRATMKVNGAW